MGSKRIGKFLIIDSLSEKKQQTIPESFRIEESTSELIILIRILFGSIQIEYRGKVFNLKENYQELISSKHQLKINKMNDVVSTIKNYHSNYGDGFEKLILKERINNNFYKSIILELISCLIEKEKKNNSNSFLYLYRAFEEISYAYPLIFTSKNGNFKHSYDKMKSFFGEDKSSGELKFYQNFLKNTVTQDILEQEVSIDFNQMEEDEISEAIIQIKKIISSSLISVQGNIVNIKFRDLFSLILEKRNKFFHKLRGSKTYLEIDKIDIDDFYSCSLEIFISWFAYTTFLILDNTSE